MEIWISIRGSLSVIVNKVLEKKTAAVSGASNEESEAKNTLSELNQLKKGNHILILQSSEDCFKIGFIYVVCLQIAVHLSSFMLIDRLGINDTA